MLVSQLCLTLCNPIDCPCQAPLWMGILQAGILEWVSMPSSRGSSQPRDQTQVSCIAGKFFTVWATTETYIGSQILYHRGSRWLSGKESACSAGDTSSVPGSGRSCGGGHGNPLQYSCLENPMDRGGWWTTDHRVTKSQTPLKQLSMHARTLIQVNL